MTWLTKERREEMLLKAKDFIPVYAAAMPIIKDLLDHADASDKRIEELESRLRGCDAAGQEVTNELVWVKKENIELRKVIKELE